MSNYISRITVNDVASYLRISELTDFDQQFLAQMLEAAKSYVMKYTGLDAAGIDQCADIAIAIYVLCQDMYDNRSLYVDSSNISNVVETILGMHSINLLPTE